MSIRRKILTMALVSEVILIALLYGAARWVLLAGFERLEDREIRQRIASASIGIAHQADTLSSLLGDYAGWDEAYRFMQGQNPTFVKHNFTDSSFADLAINVWIFLDRDGKVVLEGAFDLNAGRRVPVPPSIHEKLRTSPRLWRHSRPTDAIDGVLPLSGGTLVLASRPIITSQRQGPIVGTTIMGRFADSALVQRVSSQTGAALALGWLDSPHLSADFREVSRFLLAGENVFTRPESADWLAGYSLMEDVEGSPTLVLRARIPRVVYAQAQRSVSYIVVTYLMIGGALLGAVLILLQGGVVRRITSLSRSAAKIASSPDTSARVTVEGRDEVSDLAGSINSMLASLDRAAEQRRLQSAALEAAANAIVITDRAGAIQWVNPAFSHLTGYSLEEAVGQNPRILKSGKQNTAFYAEMWQTVLAGRLWRGDLVNRRKDGTLYDEEQTIAPVRNHTGEIAYFVSVKQDITGRKEVERLKSEFVSTVSHELRTPLTSIRGSLGLLAGGVVGPIPDKAKSLLDMAVSNTDRLVRLINDILDLEKIESGRMVFRMAPLDLTMLLNQAVETNQAYAAQFGVKLILREPLPGAMVQGDPDRLLQVMANLLSNAAKFSPHGDVVEISAGRVAHGIRVAVSDHGPGIPEEFRARIFQRFAQADASDTRQRGGTGLGLSICEAIVHKHEGTIGFETDPGAGTTFYFVLPEWHTAGPVMDSAEGSAFPRVLVCEDDHDVATLLAMMLRQAGFPTDVAYSAEDARALLSTNRYGAMTLDLILPGQDGLALLRELRAQEATRDIPVVVVSAIADTARQQVRGNLAPVIDWIGKPIGQGRLVAAVEQAARSWPQGTRRVLHVEDDASITELTAAILSETAEVFPAATLAEARALLAREEFDLVILDLDMPDGSGMELLPMPRRAGRPPTPVLIFSATEVRPEQVQGVAAALVKTRVSNEEFLAAISALVRGETSPASGVH